MKWSNIFIVLIIITLIILLITVSYQSKNISLRTLKTPSVIIANVNETYIYTKQFYLGYYAFQYRYGITDDGTFTQEVDVLGSGNFVIVRKIGVNRTNYITDVSDVNICNSYQFNPNVYPGQTNPLSNIDTYFCTLRYIRNNYEQEFFKYSLFTSYEIIASSVEIDNKLIFYLVSTFLGLGILGVPRGAVITSNLFYNGFTPLFDDVEFPQCGQRDQNFNLYTYQNSPKPTLFSNYYGTFNPLSGSCGSYCMTTFPKIDKTANINWTLYSPNGNYVLQYRDDGHFIFKNVNSLLPIYSTETDLLECKPFYLTEKVYVNEIENIRDRWLYKGNEFTYRDVAYPNVIYAKMKSEDIMLQIDDLGNFLLLKDYHYTTDNGDLNGSHPMIQSTVKTLLNSNANNVFGTPLIQDLVGLAPFNDTGNLHYNINQVMICNGMDFLNEYEKERGLVMAYTDMLINRNNKRYLLWYGQFGLRLLLCTDIFPTVSEMDWENSFWITNPYYYMFYNFNDYNPNVYPFGYPQSPGIPKSKYQTDINGIPMPKDLSSVASCLTDGFPNFPLPRYNLQSCGTFQAPEKDPTKTILIKLSSPNKQYGFYMFKTGSVSFINHNNPNSPILTSDTYTTCN